MESFFLSPAGHYLCYALIVVGVSDLFMSKLIFGKTVRTLEEKILVAVDSTEREQLNRRLKTSKIVESYIRFLGVAFIAVAAYGLTR